MCGNNQRQTNACGYVYISGYLFRIGQELVRTELRMILTSALTHVIIYKSKLLIIMIIQNVIINMDGYLSIVIVLCTRKPSKQDTNNHNQPNISEINQHTVILVIITSK